MPRVSWSYSNLKSGIGLVLRFSFYSGPLSYQHCNTTVSCFHNMQSSSSWNSSCLCRFPITAFNGSWMNEFQAEYMFRLEYLVYCILKPGPCTFIFRKCALLWIRQCTLHATVMPCKINCSDGWFMHIIYCFNKIRKTHDYSLWLYGRNNVYNAELTLLYLLSIMISFGSICKPCA